MRIQGITPITYKTLPTISKVQTSLFFKGSSLSLYNDTDTGNVTLSTCYNDPPLQKVINWACDKINNFLDKH